MKKNNEKISFISVCDDISQGDTLLPIRTVMEKQ